MTTARLPGSGSTRVPRRVQFAVLAAAALALAGCQDALDLDDGLKAERPLPAKVKQTLQAKGMASRSPVMMRIFKAEGVLEVWKQKDTGRFDLVKTYQICKWSGGLGPKIKEGDRQAPEGFYHVGNGQMNPNSSYYLSFNLGFPNSYDRSHGRTGTNLMVHGACSSAGCYSMTDEQVAEIYAFAREALRGGQKYFQVQAFPFRMTAANMARHRGSPHFAFWEMLKEGYDHFELTKIPPDVDVCGKRYVFNRTPQGGSFQPSAACPPMSMPESLSVAYAAQQQTFKQAFDLEVAKLDKAEADKKAAAEAKA
ncbi:MAG TPA: murein L,D-transpeptidase family protein, partial [Rhizobiaceae bacterium]|nr:murein L,D-transpeptidase family protein [Rhizobiaceae bacterium]